MIYCDTVATKKADLEALAVFAAQTQEAGYETRISDTAVEDVTINPGLLYEITPFLSSDPAGPEDMIVLLGASEVPDARMPYLRRLASSKTERIVAFGRYATDQLRIGASARLAYAFGREVDVVDLPERPGLPDTSIPIFAIQRPKRSAPKVRVSLFNPPIKTPEERAAILEMARSSFDVQIITQGGDKDRWLEMTNFEVPVWHLGETKPLAFAIGTDIAVFYKAPMAWPRFQSMFAALVMQGACLIDATSNRGWAAIGDPVIPGPSSIDALQRWLTSDIIPSLDDITYAMARTGLQSSFLPPSELPGLPRKRQKATGAAGRERPVLFMPTNGVGLGHAKRCSVIAAEMAVPKRARFAAFPSCVGMLRGSGFDTMPLIGRTPDLPEHATDLVNYTRLSKGAEDTSGFVFDGGHVFSSVLRTVTEQNLPSVWIRRGLWQHGPSTRIALDRQKIFDRVIVPQEAFSELNQTLSFGDAISEVGPIFQQTSQTEADRKALRQAIGEKLGKEVDRLVITMLGGGVAADRRAQTMTVASHLATVENVTNLLVVYPTSKIDPAWNSFPNTHLVRTRHASTLFQAADLFISAVGYNSFHEAIYGAVPTIFIPQMAAYMDDQRARAEAAHERRLAIKVEPWEMLTLTKIIDECLEGRNEELRANLSRVNLPEPGAQRAARIIEEVCR